MTRPAPTLFQIFAVLLLPFLWLAGVVDQYGIERSPSGFVTLDGMALYMERGAVIGCVAGLLAGSRRCRGLSSVVAFLGMVLLAGLNSWGVMFLVIAINSTSGHGIEVAYVAMTVLSWLLAFAGYFGAAGLVRVLWSRSPAPTE